MEVGRGRWRGLVSLGSYSISHNFLAVHSWLMSRTRRLHSGSSSVVSLDPLALHHALHLHALQNQYTIILNPSSHQSTQPATSSRSPQASEQTTFEVQKAALEKYRDILYRNERQSWRGEWEELVEGEMGGWLGESEETVDLSGKGGSGYASPGGRKGRMSRGTSVEPD
jgi:hypothetical protein